MKKILLFFFLFTLVYANAQKLLTPKEFLGYEPGEKFTPHYKIAAYFEMAAAAAPNIIKLRQYGQTNEGRPLYTAIIASEENMQRLEEIRINNLRLTGLLNDKPGVLNAPVIVWLSYNVHGNETSSSEAAIKVLYELLSGKNTQLNSWMKNTVVIIDPCLNPDGRDRYVNWFMQMSGKKPNSNPDAREHDEPWPGGRYNHYSFDLNRDWAWQTQLESRQRLEVYQQWMPQIHCDFHEQGPNSPYYFAPAAEPVHEAVTQWQKDVQVIIGKNHAKYFDANGWLYFTKQYFDLFYPSYGDTYPLFNGGIGMTYEQAGSGRGGTAINLYNGDTLTLADRVAHHFTSSISTIEAASDNAEKLLANFKKYFDDGRAGKTGMYKNYIISNKNQGKTAALKELFFKNQIAFRYASEKKMIKGYNYFSGREENIQVDKNDIVVAAAQPKAALVKVLFEPAAKLNDSATYDITAWALPYAYGIETLGTQENIGTQENNTATEKPVPAQPGYGYLVKYKSFNDAKFLAMLLKENIKIRFAEAEFSYKNVNYDAGTIVILNKGNEQKAKIITDAAADFGSTITAISSGFMDSGFDFGSDKLHFLKKPGVALLTGEEASATAAGEVWHLFDEQLKYPVTLMNAGNVSAASLKSFSVLIIADGYFKSLASKDAAADIKAWIRNGGKLIVSENAARQIAGLDWGLKIKKATEEKTDTAGSYSNLKIYADREKQSVLNNVPGAIYKIELDNTHPLGFGYDNFYYTLKMNDNVYEFLKDGWNVGYLKKQKPTSGFVGSTVKQLLKDGTVIGEMPMGQGSVVFFADDALFRSFWENGKMLFCNAVFYSGN